MKTKIKTTNLSHCHPFLGMAASIVQGNYSLECACVYLRNINMCYLDKHIISSSFLLICIGFNRKRKILVLVENQIRFYKNSCKIFIYIVKSCTLCYKLHILLIKKEISQLLIKALVTLKLKQSLGFMINLKDK